MTWRSSSNLRRKPSLRLLASGRRKNYSGSKSRPKWTSNWNLNDPTDRYPTGLNSRIENDQFDHSDYLSRPEVWRSASWRNTRRKSLRSACRKCPTECKWGSGTWFVLESGSRSEGRRIQDRDGGCDLGIIMIIETRNSIGGRKKSAGVTRHGRAPRMLSLTNGLDGLAVTFSDSLMLHTYRPLHSTLESETDLRLIRSRRTSPFEIESDLHYRKAFVGRSIDARDYFIYWRKTRP